MDNMEFTQAWKDLGVKERIAIFTALAAFTVGWAMTIAAFIVPPLGYISNSVLWILGQALIYSASVFGITGYFNSESKKLREEIENFVIDKVESSNSV